ncbi:DUF4118 domain-containing protein [Candidatus Methylospira mobilis]|nr:DUF4118 domain-containing protein [Candidatus Methylospira mobilis]
MLKKLTAFVRYLVGRLTVFFSCERRGSVCHYLFSMLLMGLALVLRLVIAPIDAGLQYVTFFPAVTLSAVVGGYKTGLLATMISLSFATCIFTPPLLFLVIGKFAGQLLAEFGISF